MAHDEHEIHTMERRYAKRTLKFPQDGIPMPSSALAAQHQRACPMSQHLRSIIKRCAIIWMWITGLVTLAVCVMGLRIAWLVLSDFVVPPLSDQQLLDNFQSHKTEFNQLLQMLLADQKLERVAYDYTRPLDTLSVGVTPERFKVYQALIRQVNLEHGLLLEPRLVITHWGREVDFFVSGRFWSTKGYVYTLEHPDLLVDNLDTYQSQNKKSFKAYRHIEGNWYLYFEYTVE